MWPIRLLANPSADRTRSYGPPERDVLSHARHAEALREISSWPSYRPTPLVHLRGLAQSTGLAAIWYKDESTRFGLNAFKALGGAYAVQRVLASALRERAGRADVGAQDLVAGRYRDIVSELTVTCATAGNHGRSVAWGAEMFGCRSVIYLPAVTSRHREAAIAAYGAEIVRTAGNYDEAVRRCDQDARRLGRFVVSDTSYPGYMEIPRDVMQGYTVMVAEALEQLPPGERPTHVFVQAGVGGLAAAVCAYLWEAWGAERPILVVVEPDAADPLFRSAAAGRPTRVPGEYHTIMAGLEAGEVSLLAWSILEKGADAFLTIPDEAAEATMRLLAEAVEGDPPVVAGESGAAGLAGTLAALQDAGARGTLQLGSDSRVLVFGTEGATDPESYKTIVGRSDDDVASTT
ncbi:MAG: diaminopropionate ammonia-lyase [Gemmatimonas sp. SM23_52]|jgi:diaminopropionate ammonia-lyase|nr:MAG: diaminopropionate ammonia-lyase [Gemmatimonas sp. SM23_52]